MVYKFKPMELSFEFEKRWYDLAETIDINVNLKANGEVHVREARVDLVCEQIHTRNQSGVSMGSGGASSIAGGSFSRSNDYVPSTTSVNQTKESYVHSSVVFLKDKTLHQSDLIAHTAKLKIEQQLPTHFEDAKALVRNSEESWTFKWKLVASVNIARGRDQKKQRQVNVKLTLSSSSKLSGN